MKNRIDPPYPDPFILEDLQTCLLSAIMILVHSIQALNGQKGENYVVFL